MDRRAILGLACALAVGVGWPAKAEITFAGGAGDSAATAIVVMGATGSTDGVRAEYDWLAANRPVAEVLEQVLLEDGGRYYDMLTIRVQGREEQVFFDITDFFGTF